MGKNLMGFFSKILGEKLQNAPMGLKIPQLDGKSRYFREIVKKYQWIENFGISGKS